VGSNQSTAAATCHLLWPAAAYLEVPWLPFASNNEHLLHFKRYPSRLLPTQSPSSLCGSLRDPIYGPIFTSPPSCLSAKRRTRCPYSLIPRATLHVVHSTVDGHASRFCTAIQARAHMLLYESSERNMVCRQYVRRRVYARSIVLEA
jgi:hypothetical protein